MRRLTNRRRDRGAVALIVAIVVPVLLVVLGGVVVDVGAWYSMRAQTQNGADAAAQAVAITCAKGSCNTSVAASYATKNLPGGTVYAAKYPCGHDSNSSGAHLPACDPAIENGHICPSSHPTNYVNVQVRTTDKIGLLGSLADKSTQVAACAQATWGPPSSLGSAIALTISACEWLKNTNNGTSFATAPSGGYGAGSPYYNSPPSYLATINTRRSDNSYDTTAGNIATNFYVTSNIKDPHKNPLNAPIAGSETVITTHGFGNSCDRGQPGWAAPGQFGWLSKDTCTVPISGNTYTGTTGNTPAPCGPIFLNSLQTKTPIFMPVYTTTTLNGTNTIYTLDGFAAFVVTGWNVGGGVTQWNLNGSNVPTQWDSEIEIADQSPSSELSAANKRKDANYCVTAFTGSNSDVCIYGYFTQALIPASAVPGGGGGGGNNLGVTAPYLTG